MRRRITTSKIGGVDRGGKPVSANRFLPCPGGDHIEELRWRHE